MTSEIDSSNCFFKETSIGLIPSNWNIVSLRNVVLKTEQRDPGNKPDTFFKYIDVSSVSNDLYKITNWKEIIGGCAPSRARKVVHSGDTIFATVRPYLHNIAQISPELDNQICSTGFCVIRPNPDIADPGYIFNVVLSPTFVSKVAEHQSGSSYPAVSDNVVLDQLIPLPPLAEQRAIARVLTTVRQAIEATERVIEATRQLKKAMMKHLFTYGPVPVHAVDGVQLKETEIGWVPEGWEVRNLGDLIEKPDYGFTASASINKVGPKFLRITDITDEGRVEWNTVPHCLATKKETQKYQLKNGDILIARIGATTGKSYRVHQCPEAIFASYLIRLRCREGILESRYLYQYTNTEMYWDQINSNKGGRLKGGVNIPILTGLMIPYPSIEEQLEIQSILDHIDTKLNAEKHRKLALETLFQSMLDSLMTGKIRVDESDGAFN